MRREKERGDMTLSKTERILAIINFFLPSRIFTSIILKQTVLRTIRERIVL